MHCHPSTSARRGFSLTEMIIAVAIIAVLATIAVPTYQNCVLQSQAVIARNLVETLNGAVHRFNQANPELLFSSVDASTADEMYVLRSLQYRKPTNPTVGSPYFRNDWNPNSSNATTDYRIVWAGSLFTLVSPGSTGYGLQVNFSGSDLGTPYVFPPGFSMAGE